MRIGIEQQYPGTVPRLENLPVLIVDAGGLLCALPISEVVEIMRPLPVQHLKGMDPFILGLAMIRGMPTPVYDLASIVSGNMSRAERILRYVTLQTKAQTLALAVSRVIKVGSVNFSEPANLDQSSSFIQFNKIGTWEGKILPLVQAALISERPLSEVIQRETA